MDKSEMILEFIDGTLDGGGEQRLFDEMAQRPEMRAELRQYVMIGDAVRSDREAYSPPADVERRLLGGLGLFPLVEAGGAAGAASAATAAPTVGAGTSAAIGVASGIGRLALSKLKNALFPLVVGLILGGAVGGGGVYLAVGNSSDSRSDLASARQQSAAESVAGLSGSGTAANGTSATPTTSAPISASTTPSTVPSVSASSSLSSSSELGKENSLNLSGISSPRGTSENGAKGGGGNGNSRNSAEGRSNGNSNPVSNLGGVNLTSKNDGSIGGDSLNPNGANSAANSSLKNDPNSLLRSTPREDVPLIDRAQLFPEEPAAQRSPATLPAPIQANARKNTPATLAFELRKGFLSQPFADNHARQVSGNFLQEEIVLGGFYAPDQNWYFGLEGGRERFAQSLFYNREDTLFVEQRPAVMWGGVVFGHKMEAFNIPFFVQATLGSSQYGGPIGRGRVGLNVAELFARNAPSAFSLPLSFEASSLVYTYNGQYLVTGNWGFSGGVQLRFGL